MASHTCPSIDMEEQQVQEWLANHAIIPSLSGNPVRSDEPWDGAAAARQ